MASSNTESAQPKVAIIGGGLQGLYLLLTLHRRGFSATLYEAGSNPDEVPSKGTAKDRPATEGDIQDKVTNPPADGTDSNVNDTSDAQPGAARDGEADNDGNDSSGDDGFPRQSYYGYNFDYAAHMCKKLLRACPAGSIKWAHVLSSVRTLEDGQHELAFTNGATGLCDLLLAADSGNERVSAAVSPTTPVYSSLNGVGMLFTPAVAASLDLTDIFHAIDYSALFSLPEMDENSPRGPFPHAGRGGPFGRHAHAPAAGPRGFPPQGRGSFGFGFGGGRGGRGRGRGGWSSLFPRHIPSGPMHGSHGAPPPFPPSFGTHAHGPWSAGPDMGPPPSFPDFESFADHGMPPFHRDPPPFSGSSFGFFGRVSFDDHRGPGAAFGPPPFGPHGYGYGPAHGAAPFPFFGDFGAQPGAHGQGRGPFGLPRQPPMHPHMGPFGAPWFGSGSDAETGKEELGKEDARKD